jgi:GntR family transcriptional regulator
VVAELPKSRAAERAKLVANEIEQLVVEAKKLGMELDDVLDAVSDHWERLGGTKLKAVAENKGGRRKE